MHKIRKKFNPPSILQKRIYMKYFDVTSYFNYIYWTHVFYLLLTDLFHVYKHYWFKFASKIDYDVAGVTIKRTELPIFTKKALEAGVCINLFQFFF